MVNVLRLSVDCSFGGLGLGLGDGEKVLAVHGDSRPRSADTLHAVWQRMMAENNLKASAIQQVIVTTGPGSFTGVRMGLAVAEALKLTQAVEVKGISTLTALAEQAWAAAAPSDKPAEIRVILDAAGGEVYCGNFRGFEGILSVVGMPSAVHLGDAASHLGDFKGMLVAGAGLTLPRMADLTVAHVDPGLLLRLWEHPAAAPSPIPTYIKPLGYKPSSVLA